MSISARQERPGPAWPTKLDDLVEVQRRLATASPPRAVLPAGASIGGVWFIAPRRSAGDRASEPAWAAAAIVRGPRVEQAVVRGLTGGAYAAGSLAIREGPLLQAAVRALPSRPDVLLVNATGRDHPRRAGLALHLGRVVDVPTVGVTHRPLLGTGPEPGSERWSVSPLELEGTVVAVWLRTAVGRRPIVVHPAWRTDLETAVAAVRDSVERARTPEPLRIARGAARLARADDVPPPE